LDSVFDSDLVAAVELLSDELSETPGASDAAVEGDVVALSDLRLSVMYQPEPLKMMPLG
jgi:hypothetical protein